MSFVEDANRLLDDLVSAKLKALDLRAAVRLAQERLAEAEAEAAAAAEAFDKCVDVAIDHRVEAARAS